MAIVGLVVTFAGFLVPVVSLGITESAMGRLGGAVVGIAISLFGILGIINPAYQKNAIWKKGE
jgi:hypothetical protein